MRILTRTLKALSISVFLLLSITASASAAGFILGPETLENGLFDAGAHEAVWNGTGDAGQRVSSGVYFCRFESEKFRQTQKLILLR